jgi:hypothetical protein
MVVGLMLLAVIFLAVLPARAYRNRHTGDWPPPSVFAILAAAPLVVIAWSGILLAVKPRLGSHVLDWASSILVLGAIGATTTIGVPVLYRRELGHNLVVLAAIVSFATLAAAAFIGWFTFAFF